MTENEIFDLFTTQSRNVRRLKQVFDSLVKDINFYLKKSDDFQVEIKTKLLALLYSALSEAQFLQIAYTSLGEKSGSGFTIPEIENIKKKKDSNGITEGWKLMIDLALKKVGDWEKNSDLHNRRKTMLKIINEYIKEPSILRNKIAHGQWLIAFNKSNTKINQDITNQLEELNVVEITRWFDIHQYLGLIVRDLVQSPQKGFHNNYWTNIIELEKYINKTKNWTIETKLTALKRKPIKYKKENEK